MNLQLLLADASIESKVMPNSFLEVTTGLYDKTKRFGFTNILDEDFTSYWDGDPITVPAHTTIELSNTTPIIGAGHVLAVKMTKELVDKIMIEQIKVEDVEMKQKTNNPYAVSPKAGSLGVPGARKYWEDQILVEYDPIKDPNAVKILQKQIIKEITEGNEMKPETKPVSIPTPDQFAEIQSKNEQLTKEPVKTKKVK